MRAAIPKREGLTGSVRAAAVAVLAEVRRRPWLHDIIHAIAVQLAKLPIGARMIKSVIEPQYLSEDEYMTWALTYDSLTEADRDEIRAHIETFAYRPLISVVMPAYDTDPWLLREAINSVKGQLYQNWELCIADDASPGERTWNILRQAAKDDPRIKVVRRPVNGHISAASNSALELAIGDFVALLDHDDLLPQHALYEVAAELQLHPDADIIYSDEDKVDITGRRYEPHFKTDWNPELLLSQNMISHLGVYRRSLVQQVGGFREGFEGSQDYDLTLRVAELTTADRIRHIPAILYHWRQQAGPGSFSETDLERCGAAAQVGFGK